MSQKPHPLVAVLQQVQTGLSDPQQHYLVCTTHFETEHGPVMLGTLHLHYDTVWNLESGADGFSCEVLLRPGPRQESSPIRVSYASVWQVLRGDGPNFNAGKRAGLLYENNHALSTFAQQGLAE